MSYKRSGPVYPKKSFVFAPMFNNPPDEMNPSGNDATGAFHPGMAAYKKLYEGMGGTVVTCVFNNKVSEASRRSEILNAMQQGCGDKWYDAVVFFGHGDKNRLLYTGFGMSNIGDFTDAVWDYGEPSVKVVLYACGCAAPGGIAYRIASDLACWKNYGMQVYGHSSRGHSFRNPQARRYPAAMGETGETVAPAGKIANWLRAMADQKNDLWARFPFMQPWEISDAI